MSIVGTVHGPKICPLAPAGCEACSGYHHWLDAGNDPENSHDPENDPAYENEIRAFDAANGTEHLMAYLACKHCDAWAEYAPDGDEDDWPADVCCVCGKLATTNYDDRDDCPSCGSARCELQMQRAIDYHDERGHS